MFCLLIYRLKNSEMVYFYDFHIIRAGRNILPSAGGRLLILVALIRLLTNGNVVKAFS